MQATLLRARYLALVPLLLLAACPHARIGHGEAPGTGNTELHPEIQSMRPSTGQTEAPPGVNVEVTFKNAMDADTISEDTFTLASEAGTECAAEVSYDASTRTARLNPDADLAGGTTYWASLDGVKTASQATVDYAWSFATKQD